MLFVYFMYCLLQGIYIYRIHSLKISTIHPRKMYAIFSKYFN